MNEHIETVNIGTWKVDLGDFEPNEEYDNESYPDAIFVYVVVDGWHVRKGCKDPQDLGNWIDDLTDWAIGRYSGFVKPIVLEIVGWDADASIEQIHQFTDKAKERYEGSRRRGLYKIGTSYGQARWHFTDLVIKGNRLKQSGVDARIAAELFSGYLQKADHILLVSSDSDYDHAIRVIQEHSHNDDIIELIIADDNNYKPKYMDHVAKKWRINSVKGDGEPFVKVYEDTSKKMNIS